MSSIFLFIYILGSLLAFFSIVLYSSKPVKAFSWVLVIIVLPILGVFLYLLFGINRRKIKFFSLKQTARRVAYQQTYGKNRDIETDYVVLDEAREHLSKIMAYKGFMPVGGNKVQILSEGSEAFNSIFESLEAAKNFIHLQYYLIEEGALSERLLSIFSRKIKEGVEVRFTYDAIGSLEWQKKSIAQFKAIGVSIFPMMPLQFGSLIFSLNYRNHRKIVIVDGEIGFTGGFNISDKYLNNNSELGKWDDVHLKIEGPAVEDLHRIFMKDYYFASNNEQLVKPKYLPEINKKQGTILQLVSGGPDSGEPKILQQYIKMINMAKKSISISNPYFIPNEPLLEAIKMAAIGGVEIKILVPGKSDSKLAHYSMFSYFEAFLKVGVKIYLQQANFLHSKIIVIDEDVASIGSGNFDSRSFEHNYETNVLIYDGAVAKQLANLFEKNCQSANLLLFDTFKKRKLWKKLLEGISRFFSPLL
jgi:cardiolipin synthase